MGRIEGVSVSEAPDSFFSTWCKSRKMEWLEQIKKAEILDKVGGRGWNSVSYFLQVFSLLNACSLRKIREWILLSYLSIPSGSSIQSILNPDPKNTSCTNPHILCSSTKIIHLVITLFINSPPKPPQHSIWLSFYPKEMLKKVIMPSVLILTLCAGEMGWETHA